MKCIVCGTGPSLNMLPVEVKFHTIGVNDIFHSRKVDECLVVDPTRSFTKKMQWMNAIDCPFYCNNKNEWTPFVHSEITQFSFGKYFMEGYKENRDSWLNGGPKYLNIGHTSVFAALMLASYYYDEIGLIGCDINACGHAWQNDGHKHKLSLILPSIQKDFQFANKVLRENGVTVWNLSPISAVTAFPKKDLNEFLKN